MSQKGNGLLWMSSLTAGLLLAAAALFPVTWVAVICSWSAVVALSLSLEATRRIYLRFFTFGVVFHLISFYWLPATLVYFGGFSTLVSWGLHLLFAIVSSLQFLLCAWLVMRLSGKGERSSVLLLPLAWYLAEVLVPRMFPWALAHNFIVWKSFSGLAEFCGASPLSALIIFWTEVLLACFQLRSHRLNKKVFVSFFVTLLLLLVGFARAERWKQSLQHLPSVSIGLIQGNLDAKEKGGASYLESNLEQYRRLSQRAEEAGASLVLWPESVMTEWTPELEQQMRGLRFDPNPRQTVPLLYGLLSFRENKVNSGDKAEKYFGFNSAFGIDAKGSVLGRYHKRILMPFGEYLPFEQQFPQLRQFSPQSGDFSSGDLEQPIQFNVTNRSNEVVTASVFPLICYEDLIPELGRLAVLNGANLLVNLTNDAWYGNTRAPYQHHLIASWRAIETRRFLARVTNTGYTAVVDPLGNTIAGLPLFVADILLTDVKLVSEKTWFVRHGNTMNIIFAGIGLVFLLNALIRNKKILLLA